MDLTMATLPADDVPFDPDAYKAAIARMKKGSVVTIFTPDDTHHAIALACIEAGLHVLCAKPVVKKLEDHLSLAAAAKSTAFCARWSTTSASIRSTRTRATASGHTWGRFRSSRPR